MKTCGQALPEILEAYGIDVIFGIPGVHTIELYRGVAKSSIRHITPRHEQGAGFMADGYARATGNIAACFIITGPGMTNIITAMAQAMRDSIPMLVISSTNHTHRLGMGEGDLHELPNQRALVSEACAFSHTLMRPDELPKILAKAYSVFKSGRPAPVHIEIPIDVLSMPADHVDLTPWPIPTAPAPAPSSIQQAATLLFAAKCPLIVIGGGAINASSELLTLAEKLDAPVINTVNAKGILPFSHPLSVGGSCSAKIIREAFEQADVILAVGTEFAETDYNFFFSGPLKNNGKLIRIDIDAAQLTRNLRPHLAILSDANHALVSLNENLSGKPISKKEGHQRASLMRTHLEEIKDKGYSNFFSAIREILPEVIIVGDSTQPVYYAWLSYETEAPRRYFHSASGYGTLGYAIPAAVGAKLGKGDAPVICLIGDGAAQFSIGELASAVEAQLPVIFIIWNNIGYGEIRKFMEDANVEKIGVDIYTPDYVTIAKGFGLNATRAGDLNSLKQALINATQTSGPTLIEVLELDFTNGTPNYEGYSQ